MTFDIEKFMQWEPPQQHIDKAKQDFFDQLVKEENIASSVRLEELVDLAKQSKCWSEIREAVQSLKQKTSVKNNVGAMDFLAEMEDVASLAWGHWELDQVMKPIAKRMESQRASKNAKGKNQDIREWVKLKEEKWFKENPGKKMIKKQFAEALEEEINTIFAGKVFGSKGQSRDKNFRLTADRIARTYLSGSGKGFAN